MVLNHLANLCVKGWKDNMMYSGGVCQSFWLIKKKKKKVAVHLRHILVENEKKTKKN